MKHQIFERGEYSITTDPSKIDFDVVHGYLARSYWSEGIPRAMVERAATHSFCFSLFKGTAQIGFARLVTDYTTYAYLCDVFILEEYRGLGLSKWLMECVVKHPELQGLRRWTLATRDAHGLYRKIGFTELKAPDRFMELHRPDVYKQPQNRDAVRFVDGLL